MNRIDTLVRHPLDAFAKKCAEGKRDKSCMRVKSDAFTAKLAAAICVAFSLTCSNAFGEDRSFTFDDRSYHFDFSTRLTFFHKGFLTDTWSAIFQTLPDKNDFVILFFETSGPFSGFVKGYEDIWASANEGELDKAVREVHPDFYVIDVPDYDGSRGMYIAGVRSSCPGECIVGFQIMYRHNLPGLDRKLIMSLRSQLIGHTFGPTYGR